MVSVNRFANKNEGRNNRQDGCKGERKNSKISPANEKLRLDQVQRKRVSSTLKRRGIGEWKTKKNRGEERERERGKRRKEGTMTWVG